ncbi:hypothetical protein [Yunchengibacter salinarum]|uniref:hypothetical protein n=1 Tax=Yunchengibacter salinarum TaxID=3133399 RepID=UPI0035B69D18
MTLIPTLIGLGVALLVWMLAWWRDKHYEPGRVGLISPIAVQMVALVAILVFAAHLVSLLTGWTWRPPYRG